MCGGIKDATAAWIIGETDLTRHIHPSMAAGTGRIQFLDFGARWHQSGVIEHRLSNRPRSCGDPLDAQSRGVD